MKSEIFGKAIAIFGGNIGVSSVKYNTEEPLYGLVLYSLEDGKYKIGEDIENPDEILDEPNIELVFNNIESINVLIDSLNELKEHINNE